MHPEKGGYYLLDSEIYRVKTLSSGTDEVILEQLSNQTKFVTRFSSFESIYKRVFKVQDVATFLNRSPRSIYRYEQRGQTNKQKLYPVGAHKMLRFYTVEDIMQIRNMISEIPQGRPRKDGRIINNLTEDAASFNTRIRKRYG